MASSAEYENIRARCRDAAQERYEGIRGNVLLGVRSVKQCARQTGHHSGTIRQRVKRFLEDGIRGLLDAAPVAKEPIREDIRDRLRELLATYPNFGHTELQGIIHKQFRLVVPIREISKLAKARAGQPFQRPLPFHKHTSAFAARREVIRLALDGWSPTSIAAVMGLSRRHVYRLIDAFEREQIAGLHPKSRAPKRPLKKITLPLLTEVYHNEQQFVGKDFTTVVDHDLQIEHKPIEKRKPFQTLIEPFFNIQRRLADANFNKATTFADYQRAHLKFVQDYNTTPHQALLDDKTRKHDTPVEELGPLRVRPLPDEKVEEIFSRVAFHRTTDRHGYFRFQNWRVYAEDGIPRTRVEVWVSAEQLSVEFQKHLLASYPCRFDREAKRMLDLPGKATIFQTPFRSPQLYLFDRELLGWIKVRYLGRMPGRRHRTVEAATRQLVFEYAI